MSILNSFGNPITCTCCECDHCYIRELEQYAEEKEARKAEYRFWAHFEWAAKKQAAGRKMHYFRHLKRSKKQQRKYAAAAERQHRQWLEMRRQWELFACMHDAKYHR